MFPNFFLPGGITGDRFKVYLLNKVFKTSVKKLLQIVLFDHLGGLVSVIFLLFGLFLFGPVDSKPLETSVWGELTIARLYLTFPAFWLIQKLVFSDFFPSFWTGNTWSLGG